VFAILALASAVVYGAADFIGGLTSKRASTIVVVVLSQLAGLLLLAAVLPFMPASSPQRADWWWGATAGLTGGIAVALLYHALAAGTMAIVAPIAAVTGVIVPVFVSLGLGERPGPGALAGIAIALVAIALVSRPGEAPAHVEPDRRTSGIGLALGAGVAIGMFYLSLARTGANAGLWPLVAARLTSVTLFGIVAAATGRSVVLPARVGATVAVGGALDMLANLLYLLATRAGPLSVAVTLSSLYPASTVLLARAVLNERLSATQTIGVVFALGAVVLIVGATG
jgi:drug/metabolite transporter (DMT)-like permease